MSRLLWPYLHERLDSIFTDMTEAYGQDCREQLAWEYNHDLINDTWRGKNLGSIDLQIEWDIEVFFGRP